MEYFAEYGVFLAKILTIGVCIFGLASLAALVVSKYEATTGRLVVRDLNKHYDRLVDAGMLAGIVISEKEEPKEDESEEDDTSSATSNVYVVNFTGDIAATETDRLREEITTILQLATSKDRAVVKLSSPGGMVHKYGFAASQLARFKEKGIPLTICVDHVAASGGYMMACVADHLVAAPFAIIGSIGVVAQVPNLHRWLKNRDIDFEVFTAGKHKRTVTVFGENTDAGKQKFKEELEETHKLFKDFIAEQRPSVDIEALSTGESWYGTQALERNLVDAIQTSDDYLLDLAPTSNIYQIRFIPHKTWSKKLGDVSAHAISRAFTQIMTLILNRESFKS